MSSLPFTPFQVSQTVSPTSPTTSPTSTQNTGDTSTNATLYLYTFLATLVLLLAVSSAIVIRSLVLRRRHQRLVEEAIRTGTWMLHGVDSGTGRRRRDIGQKPKIWEALVHSNDDDDGENEKESEKSKWGDIMPVYAEYVNEPALSPQGPATGSAENAADLSSRPSRFRHPFTRRRSPPSPQPSTGSSMATPVSSLPSSSPTATPTPAVRVAVLIAMPSPLQRHTTDENGPPVVEIGIVEADVKADEAEASSRDRS